MYHKRSKGYQNEEVSPSKRLKANLQDLFLGNDVSATRARDIFEDCDVAGNRGFRKLAKAGKHGQNRNVRRDLISTILRGSAWPSSYFAEIRVWDRKQKHIVKVKVPMLLPHEVLAAIVSRSDKQVLLGTTGFMQDSLDHLDFVKTQTNIQEMLGVGLWLDGTPCNWDRSESVETIAMSFPGLAGKYGALRIPLCCPQATLCQEGNH